jgi:hypothetical protein
MVGGRAQWSRLLRPGKGRGGSAAPVWGRAGRRPRARGRQRDRTEGGRLRGSGKSGRKRAPETWRPRGNRANQGPQRLPERAAHSPVPREVQTQRRPQRSGSTASCCNARTTKRGPSCRREAAVDAEGGAQEVERGHGRRSTRWRRHRRLREESRHGGPRWPERQWNLLGLA